MTQRARRRLRGAALAAWVLAVGCGGPIPGDLEAGEPRIKGAEARQSVGALSHGERLFRQETFGGNGRTCETCHGMVTGTVSPAELQARYLQNPSDPMFRALDSDDGAGQSYQRLLRDATILVPIRLPSNTQLLASSATHVTLQRGIPSTLDTPALDPVLMMDGRAPTLTAQAHDAIMGHAEATRVPTAQELESIASFEQTLFSSQELKDYARSGVAPALPEGTTASERRGRAFFRPEGACGQCHSGPLLNETGPQNILGQPPGSRFSTAFISEINPKLRPLHTFLIRRSSLLVEVRLSPDPGRFLITGRIEDFNHFKIGSLRNIQNTAPYFHDNSGQTLEEVMNHYTVALLPYGIVLTPQDAQDIIAWMKLL
jgi:mono/diheme cytochrome c family protein